MILFMLALLQGPGWAVSPAAPAVGDTVQLRRAVPLGAAARARLQPLARTSEFEPLADPVSVQKDSTLVVTYAVAFFAPGAQAIPMPPLELRYASGRVDVVEGDTARVRVRSVLPAGDSLPPPKPSAPPLARQARRPDAAMALVAATLLVLLAWGWWRRRVRAVTPPPVVGPAVASVPVDRWVAAGETRAVAALAAERLRGALAQAAPEADRSLPADALIAALERSRADWPLRDIAEVLRALERVAFAPAVQADVLDLARRADGLARELTQPAEVA